MDTVWVLTKDNDPNPEAFATEKLALGAYREHIEDRTSGMDWYDKNFEWHDDGRNRSCYCYGEFVARLNELKIRYDRKQD